MKYTVLIRQPVPDEVRPQLEQQLVERFGLTPELAQRLANRRSGRLMKPTSEARAKLLLDVFQSVGVAVALEEVRPDGSESAALLAPTTPAADPFVATGAPDPFAAPAPDPFSPPFAPGQGAREPIVVSPTPQSVAVGNAKETGAEGLPDWARPTAEKATPAPAADDWADFAGSLKVPEQQTPARQVEDLPRTTTEFLTEVTEDSGKALPRNSVAQQIRLGTLLPLGAAGLLTLLLLGLTLPQTQARVTQADAQTFASAIGVTLDNNPVALNNDLGAIARNPNVGFVRVETPNSNAVTRSIVTEDLAGLNQEIETWAARQENAGTLRIGGEAYTVSRVAIVRGADGTLSSVPGSEQASGQVVRRVTVGLSNGQARAAVRNSLLVVLLTTLLGLGLALAFAARAARQIVGPLERLVEVADAISLGDLTRPVKMERNDEIGDLAQALERMRLSLEAAMDRLRRRKRM